MRELQTAEIADAIAYISEQIDALSKEQNECKANITGELKQWRNVNLELIKVLQEQSQWQPKLMKQQLQQTQHLLKCAETSERLGHSTQSLTSSTNGLLSLTEELKLQSVKLSNYLQSDQAQRLELLQNGLKSLLAKIGYWSVQTGQYPGKSIQNSQNSTPVTGILNQNTTNSTVGQSFRSSWWMPGMIASLLVICVSTSLGLYYLGKDISQANQRTGWALTKLERLENFLGIN